MFKDREVISKEPITLLWIIIGLLIIIACAIGIERLVPRY